MTYTKRVPIILVTFLPTLLLSLLWLRQPVMAVAPPPAGALHPTPRPAVAGRNVRARLAVTATVPVTGLVADNSSPTALGAPTVFTATVAAGSPVTYTWDFGDDAAAVTTTLSVISHTYAAAGAYTATVTAANSVSAVSATTAVRLAVAIGDLQLTSDSPTALGQPTRFTATISSSNSVSYTWDFGDGSAVTTTTVPVISHTYAAAGTYTALIIAANSVSAPTATTTVEVVAPIAGLGLVDSGPTALGTATTFTATLMSGSHLTYTWDFGDGSALVNTTTAVTAHAYTAAGLYTATVTATNILNTATASTAVLVQVPIGFPLLSEGFEGAFPPPGWRQYNLTSAGEVWQPTAARAHSGQQSAFHDDAFDAQDAWLVTPPLLLPAGAELIFWQNQNYDSFYEKHSVWVSTGSSDPKDDGYVQVAEVGPGAEDTWEESRLDLSAFAGHTVYLAFRYEGDFADEWYVDDVQLSGDLTLVADSPTLFPQTTTLTATVPSGSDVSFAWDFGDDSPPLLTTTAVVTHTYDALGVYTATVSASNSVSAASASTTVWIKLHTAYLPLLRRPEE